MKFHIPFTFLEIEVLKKKSVFFASKVSHKKKSKLGESLESARVNLTREEYLGICRRSFTINFILSFIFSTIILSFVKVDYYYLIGLMFALMFSTFIFIKQKSYPKMFIARKQKEIEKNLLPALEDMSIQLSSGIPLFNILINLSVADYGALSLEFAEAVKDINSGEPEAEVLERLGEKNPSIFFRRALWQISNGMNAGSDMGIVIKDNLKALGQEQMIQIQNYGSTLNPLIVMYMLISIIIPALSVTFLTILSSMLGLGKSVSMLLFFGVLIFNILFQVMFLGIIKSRRPSLF